MLFVVVEKGNKVKIDVRKKTKNDKRLIDADALMDVIRQHEYCLATKQSSVDYGMFMPEFNKQ